jgi:septal ring factor EnvC (AmiA/AmiB activator)
MEGLDFSKINGENEEQATVMVEFAVGIMSLDLIKPQFDQYRAKVKEIEIDAKFLEVRDDETLKFAVELGGTAKRIAKAIEKKRKDTIQPPNDYVKAVNNFCKIFTDSLDLAESVTKRKISQYQAKIELDRREAERKMQEAARKFQEELQRKVDEENRKAREEAALKAEEETRARLAREAEERKEKESKKAAEERRKREEAEIEAVRKKAEEEARAIEVKVPEVPMPIMPERENITRTELGTSAHQRKEWKHEVVNPDLVPREYLTVDDKKIREAVKMGVREIPGVRIFEDSTTVFRA